MKSITIDKRKTVATIVVTAFFIFFWIQGPFKNAIEISIAENETSDNFTPVLVLEDKSEVSTFHSVEDTETKGDGFSMVLGENNLAKHIGLIEDKKSVVNSSEYGDELYKNAIHHFDQKVKFTLQQTDNFYYTSIEAQDGNYFYFQSKGIADEIKGYSGPINIGVYIREDGFVHSMVHVSSIETESYLRKIAKTHYFGQYKHIALDKTHKVDAISGATISSKAMAMTTTKLVSELYPFPLSDLVDRAGVSNFETNASLNWYWIPQVLLIVILFLYAYQKKLRKSKRYVLLTSIASVAFIGFYLNDSFTYITFMHPFIGTSISSFMGIYALFVLLGAIWGKNTYCKYICPYGNVQRLQLKLWKGKSSKFPLSNKWIKRIRFFILVGLIFGILAGFRSLSHLEPYPYVFGFEIQSLWYFVFAVAALLINWVYPMIWCRLLCPTGSVLDTLSFLSEKNKISKR